MASSSVARSNFAEWGPHGAAEVLTVESPRKRAWHFVWPARFVVLPLTDGISCTVGRQELQALAIGRALAAEPWAAHARIVTEAGAAFRVLFERPCRSRRVPTFRMPLPRLFETSAWHPVERIFGDAFANDPCSPSRRLSRTVAYAREHLVDNFEAGSDLAALAKLVEADANYLCRSFRREIGLPPFRYRVHVRIAHARALLARGRDCVAAAHAVGFYDQSHLSRWFRELTGTTPGSYAQTHGAAVLPSAA